MDTEVWCAAVHRVTECQTRLSELNWSVFFQSLADMDALPGCLIKFSQGHGGYHRWSNFYPFQVVNWIINSGLGGSDGKESACNTGDPGSIPGLGRSPGEINGYSLQYSCLGNPTDRGACQATVHGVAKSWTWLNDLQFPRGGEIYIQWGLKAADGAPLFWAF